MFSVPVKMPQLKTHAAKFVVVYSCLSLMFTRSLGFHGHFTRLSHVLPSLQTRIGSSLGAKFAELEQTQRTRQLSEVIASKKRGVVPFPRREPSLSKTRLSINDMLGMPIGSLNERGLTSLCNSIRHVEEESSSQSLIILQRILFEIDHWENVRADRRQNAAILKPIHVFAVLTAISRDVRSRKKLGERKSFLGVGLDDRIEQLRSVVFLLKRLVDEKESAYCDKRCFNEDVVSFATMITADASRWEKSATDASIYFFRLMQNTMSNEEWDPRLIGAVLNSLATWGRAEEAQSLLDEVMGLTVAKTNYSGDTQQNTSKIRLDPSQAGSCYDAVVRAWSKRAKVIAQRQTHPILLDESTIALSKGKHILLDHMPTLGLSITNRTCAAALHGYASLGLGEEAEMLLTEIEMLFQPLRFLELSQSHFPSNLDVTCYNNVLASYCQSCKGDDIFKAENLFKAMVDQQPTSIASVIPSITTINIIPPRADFISYSTLLNGYCRSGMVDKAEKLLDSMRSASSLDPLAPMPTLACYLSVIRALEKSHHVDAPERMLALIEAMEQMRDNDQGIQHNRKRKHPFPNRAIYISALRCMSKNGRGTEAELLLTKLRNTYPWSRGWTDIQAYTLVMRSWGWSHQVNREEAAIRVEVLFHDLQYHVKEGHLKPLDVNIYNIVLNCYAKAGLADKAEALLTEMTETLPNAVSYSLVIKALSNSKDQSAVSRAWSVLYSLGYRKGNSSVSSESRLSPVFDESIEPFNSMLKLLAKRGLALEAEMLLDSMDELVLEGMLKIGPDVSSYEAVLEALGRCRDSDSAQRAEVLVTRLEVLSELGGCLQPSLLVYNNLLNCYGNAGMAGKAERLFDRLIDSDVPVKPDDVTLGSTIKAIVNSGKGQENALARVEKLVELLSGSDGKDNIIISAHRLRLYAKFGMGSDAERLLRQMKNAGLIHYTIVLNAWARSEDQHASEKAEALFREMEQESEFNLDIAAYHGLLLNYSLRGQVEKAERLVEAILHKSSIAVNRQTFTMLVNAYTNAKDTTAPERAEELLDKMRELHASGNKEAEPDDVAYSSIIRCIRSGNVQNITEYEKIELMSRLQIEKWPIN
ncbi:hypothetical protein ACHAW6_007282 [Cyclotella cf. meneghiniana]